MMHGFFSINTTVPPDAWLLESEGAEPQMRSGPTVDLSSLGFWYPRDGPETNHSWILRNFFFCLLPSFSSFTPQKSTTKEIRTLQFPEGLLSARNWAGTLTCPVSFILTRPCGLSITIPVLQMKKPKLSDQETRSVDRDGARIRIQFCLASNLQSPYCAFHEKFLSN